MTPLPQCLLRYLLLYGAVFLAFGVASPFFPAFLQSRGLTVQEVGYVLGLGTAVRIGAGPLGGWLADRAAAPRLVLAAFLAWAGVVALAYVPSEGLLLLGALSLLHAATLAPVTPVTDALAIRTGGFPYGWVRGAGSAAFIAGTALSGQTVAAVGLSGILWSNAGFLLLACVAAVLLPTAPPAPRPAREPGALAALLAVPGFLRLLAISALVLGSHALHDGFEVIRWSAAGIGPELAGLLWAEAVAAEVLVFLLLGPILLRHIGPGGALALSAAAGVLRWSVEAVTTWLPAMALVQPLHGLTFALLHLACLQIVAQTVPERLTATALAAYGTVAAGTVTALLTALSGRLYGSMGGDGFWLMAGLCGVAFALAVRPTSPGRPPPAAPAP